MELLRRTRRRARIWTVGPGTWFDGTTAEVPTLADLLRRPEVSWQALSELARIDAGAERIIAEVAVEIKYEGYVKKQQQQVERFKRLEDQRLPGEIDYHAIHGLSLEAREKAGPSADIARPGCASTAYPCRRTALLIFLKGDGAVPDEENEVWRRMLSASTAGLGVQLTQRQLSSLAFAGGLATSAGTNECDCRDRCAGDRAQAFCGFA